MAQFQRVEVPGRIFLSIIYDRDDGTSFSGSFGPYESRAAAQRSADFINKQDRVSAGLLPAFASVSFEAFESMADCLDAFIAERDEPRRNHNGQG